MYPFTKVALINTSATTVFLVKSDPKVEYLISLGWRIYREWEVLSPVDTKEIWSSPV